MSKDEQNEKSDEIDAAIKTMAAWIEEKERAYESGDPIAIKRAQQREAELRAESIRIGREWAEKQALKTRDAQRPNGSWDPLTQAKFIFEINAQAGTPISMPEAYRTAELAVRESGTDPKSLLN